MPEVLDKPFSVDLTHTSKRTKNILDSLPENFLPVPRTQSLPKNSLVITEKVTPENLDTCFLAPHVGLIELGDGGVDLRERVEFIASVDCAVLSITSKTASTMNAAPYFCRHAKPFTRLAPKIRAIVELSVQEASINALAHGNLGLKSAYDETADDVRSYAQLVRTRSQVAPFASKRIDFLVWEREDSVFVAIRDQGAGFRLPDRRKQENTPQPETERRRNIDRRQSGRGLDIMRQFSDGLWLSGNGTCICMRFKT